MITIDSVGAADNTITGQGFRVEHTDVVSLNLAGLDGCRRGRRQGAQRSHLLHCYLSIYPDDSLCASIVQCGRIRALGAFALPSPPSVRGNHPFLSGGSGVSDFNHKTTVKKIQCTGLYTQIIHDFSLQRCRIFKLISTCVWLQMRVFASYSRGYSRNLVEW